MKLLLFKGFSSYTHRRSVFRETGWWTPAMIVLFIDAIMEVCRFWLFRTPEHLLNVCMCVLCAVWSFTVALSTVFFFFQIYFSFLILFFILLHRFNAKVPLSFSHINPKKFNCLTVASDTWCFTKKKKSVSHK